MDATPYFPAWRARCAPLGAQLQRGQTAAQSLSGLAALFGGYFPGLLVPARRGAGSRQRDLPRVQVFWAFLGQVLCRGASCRWALARLQLEAHARGRPILGSSTSAYCQARAALPLCWLQALFAALDRWFEPRVTPQGRPIRVIDGTGFSMPDTDLNRRRWPYAGRQQLGCGFPTGKLVGLFCAHSGRLLAFAFDSWKRHDLALARRLLRALRPGEILLADRAYCGWVWLALLRRRHVDFVVRLHQRRHRRSHTLRSWWEPWIRPQRPAALSQAAWQRFPSELMVRIVRWPIHRQGWRTQHVVLATSLLDQTAFPDQAIAQLYARRWQVELHYRQIKTNLGLDVLRGRSPALIERELWMHAIAYNLVRALLLETACCHQLPIERLSFKGALDALLSWADQLIGRRRGHRSAFRTLLAQVGAVLLPIRPHRHEPRARKRRPSGSYQLLTAPRHRMRISPSRRR